jgi:hypothetical protein
VKFSDKSFNFKENGGGEGRQHWLRNSGCPKSEEGTGPFTSLLKWLKTQ